MKILITGCNKNQVTENFYLRQQLKVVPSHYALLRGLRADGHEVEQRLVEIGEDLSEYDEVIVFLASPRQALQLAFYNGLWAIAARPNCILAFDDWQVEDIYKGIASCHDKDSLLKEFTINQTKMCDPKCSFELLEPHTDALLGAVKQIATKTNRMMISAFAGGDTSLLLDYPADRLFTYNPNPFHRNRVPGNLGDIDFDELSFMEQQTANTFEDDFVPAEKKQRTCNFSSLVQGKTRRWLKQQDIPGEWDIEFFGSRKDGQRRLTEGDMCKVYAEQWVCLMPGYKHAGSGWWRARPLQVADAGSILIGDPQEMMLYYKNEFLANLRVTDLTNASDIELASIAIDQRESLYRNHPLDKAIMIDELNKILKA